jgi:hypothetical protein
MNAVDSFELFSTVYARHDLPERLASLATHDGVDLRDVVVRRRDGGVMSADDDLRRGVRLSNEASDRLDDRRLVRVAGDPDDVRFPLRQHASERGHRKGREAEIDHAHLVRRRNDRGEIS